MLNRARITLAIAILALAAVIGSVAVVGAESDETSNSEPPRTLTVNGDGAASAAPDIADIQLGVETIDEDPKAAIDDNTSAMDSVIEALIDLEVAEDDIQTRSFNMWVEQIYDEDGPTGEFRYHVVNQITVRVRDIDMTGDVLGAALGAGANNVRGISFGVEDTQALEEAARDAAVDNAVAKAEQLAGAWASRSAARGTSPRSRGASRSRPALSERSRSTAAAEASRFPLATSRSACP